MSAARFDRKLSEIRKRKKELVGEIQKEIKYLDTQDFKADVDIKALKQSKGLSTGPNISKYIDLRDKLAELDFLEKVSGYLDDVPLSNGTSFYDKIDVSIGIIADEFLYNSFKDVADFHYIEKDNYAHLRGKLDVVLIASTWKGIHGDWKGMGNPNISKIRKSLSDMIAFFREDGAKIVFYSKEDPTNYDFFVDIAQKCDYIFTTAAEKVADYKKDCQTDNVFVLEFGVNPIYNNPIGIKSDSELDGALFAGSWYEKYPHRQVDTRILFDGVINADEKMKIIDRNFNLALERHFYPQEYLPYVSPSIDHESLQKLLKLYRWVINLNSVKYSQTMFANRVYELQAMGNLILSNYSIGINNLFPNIFIAFNSDEIESIMHGLTEKELYLHRLFGVRQALRKHTTFHRINHLLHTIGFDGELLPDRHIAVIVDDVTDQIQVMFDNQSYADKTLLTVDAAKETTDTFDYITFFHPDSFYGEYYLEDMVNAFKYTDVDFVTKDSYFKGDEKVQGMENNYIEQWESRYRTVFEVGRSPIKDAISDELPVLTNGYSSDSTEYNESDEPVFKTASEKKFSIIIPTYNNGNHLYGKCFMSLRRSGMFHEMEVVIVDDGSTDGETVKIIRRLARMYDNIIVYEYGDGGSGSASRPRNKGIDLVSTDYITYLDPDNEAVNDGYAKLYHELAESDFDLVIGNMLKVTEEEKVFDYYHYTKKRADQIVFSDIDVQDFLGKTNFKVQSIQALMMKKSLVIKNDLKMISGAVGQDTLFFHELIVHAQDFKLLDEVIHIYYANVEGSAVNHITKNTFEKYMIMENARMQFLQDKDLMDIYMDFRFNYYFANWYFKKLELVKDSDYAYAISILTKIYHMYHDLYPEKIDPEITRKMEQLKNVFVES